MGWFTNIRMALPFWIKGEFYSPIVNPFYLSAYGSLPHRAQDDCDATISVTFGGLAVEVHQECHPEFPLANELPLRLFWVKNACHFFKLVNTRKL